MLHPHFKGWKLVIHYVGKEKAHLIASKYDRYVLFSLLVHVYKVLNLYVVSEVVVVASIMNNLKLSNFWSEQLWRCIIVWPNGNYWKDGFISG